MPSLIWIDEVEIMYVSIRRYKTNADLVDKAMKKVEESFLPLVMKIPGFVNYYGVDAGDGVVAFVNFFQSEEGVEQSNKTATKWVKENMTPYFPLPPDITAGKVLVDGKKPLTE